FAGADAAGTTVGAVTAGSDIVGRHEYTAAAWWSLDGHQPGWSASYTAHVTYPDLVFTASRDLVSVSGIGCVDTAAGISCTTQRDVRVGVAARWLFPQVERSFSFSLGYDLDWLANDTLAPALE